MLVTPSLPKARSACPATMMHISADARRDCARSLLGLRKKCSRMLTPNNRLPSSEEKHSSFSGMGMRHGLDKGQPRPFHLLSPALLLDRFQTTSAASLAMDVPIGMSLKLVELA